jgi:UDP-N-acetylmuramoyl-tripeptide--D-alanyl-D-alanine ligase
VRLDGAPETPIIRVDDAVRALGRLALAWRGRTGARVIGITGTAGKTTVKETLAAVLATQGGTARNTLNQNNRIGLPLSMLAAAGDERFWVMEAGVSLPGDMDALGAILEPDVALILNAACGHTAGLGRNVAGHKARLLRWLKPDGIGLVCADYPELEREALALRPGPARLEFFTAAGKPLFYAATYLGAARSDAGGSGTRGRFRVRFGSVCREMDAPFPGAYGAENVIAVSAAAHLLGMDPEAIAAGMAAAVLPAQRFHCERLGRWLIVDDSYNANPLSMARMLESAGALARERSRPDGEGALICVLGDMLELGELAREEHEKLGQAIGQCRARMVFWKGEQAEAVRAGLLRADYPGDFIPLADADPSWMDAVVLSRQAAGGVILFKGSRAMHLERDLARFRDRLREKDDQKPESGPAGGGRA